MRRFTLPDLRLYNSQQWAAGDSALRGRLASILTFQELRPALEGELRRSRRYERPLALLTLVPDVTTPPPFARTATGNGNGDGNGHGDDSGNGRHPLAASPYATQLRFLLLGSILCGTLRESDIVGYDAERHEFCALLPECDTASATGMVTRLHRTYLERTGDGVRAGIARFPEDGLTLDDLLAQARVALVLAPVRPLARGATPQDGQP